MILQMVREVRFCSTWWKGIISIESGVWSFRPDWLLKRLVVENISVDLGNGGKFTTLVGWGAFC